MCILCVLHILLYSIPVYPLSCITIHISLYKCLLVCSYIVNDQANYIVTLSIAFLQVNLFAIYRYIAYIHHLLLQVLMQLLRIQEKKKSKRIDAPHVKRKLDSQVFDRQTDRLFRNYFLIIS